MQNLNRNLLFWSVPVLFLSALKLKKKLGFLNRTMENAIKVEHFIIIVWKNYDSDTLKLVQQVTYA